MIKPNLQEILEHLPKGFVQIQSDFDPSSHEATQTFKQLETALKQASKDMRQKEVVEFLQRIEQVEYQHSKQQPHTNEQALVYLSYIRNFTFNIHKFQIYLNNILMRGVCEELIIVENSYFTLYDNTSLDEYAWDKLNNTEHITKHILFKVLCDSLGYDTYYTYLGYWKRENNKKIFCPFLALHPNNPYAKALDDYLSQIPRAKKEKGRFYYDIASAPSLEYSYPNITYFQIHKIISLCYKAISKLKKWQIQAIIEHFTKIGDVDAAIHRNDFADILARLKILTPKPDMTDCVELLFHHIYSVAKLFHLTDVLLLAKQLQDEIKNFATNHSSAQVQELLEVSYNASRFYPYCDISNAHKDIMLFLNALRCGMRHYPQLFMSRGYRASLFVDSENKSLALKAMAILNNENKAPTQKTHQKAYFEIARRVVFSHLYISSKIKEEFQQECIFYLQQNGVFAFLSHLAEYQRYGRGLYEWNGFDYAMNAYCAYLRQAHKAKHTKHLNKLRRIYAREQAKGAVFEIFARTQQEALDQARLDDLSLDSVYYPAFLDIAHSKQFLQAMLDVISDKQPRSFIATESKDISTDEPKRVAYIHLESFFGFIYDECMLNIKDLNTSEFIKHCLNAILQQEEWACALKT